MAKWVYRLERQGRGPRRHANLWAQGRPTWRRRRRYRPEVRRASPSPPRLTPVDYANNNAIAQNKDEVDKALESVEQGWVSGVSATPTIAAGLGALRRARLDARHDGHASSIRPQRSTVLGLGKS